MMARNLDLLRGGHRYIKTAAYGHFGRDDPDFTCALPKDFTLLSRLSHHPLVCRDCDDYNATVAHSVNVANWPLQRRFGQKVATVD